MTISSTSTNLLPRPHDHAAIASLAYTSDENDGFSRRRRGKGFQYRDAAGDSITDPGTVERIQALGIPPAWTNVWICPEPSGHLQATGYDARGRKQYRYHPRWTEVRDEAKFAGLAEFARALPDLRARVETDLRRRNLSQERVVASVVWLLDHTMIRIGNAAYSRDNKSFGLTTLRDRHVNIEGDKLRFVFRGKAGKSWNIDLIDRRMARLVRSTQDLPGQNLFQYLDPDGDRHTVQSQDVNAYIREVIGGDFTAKYFRTWGGTTRALSLFGKAPLPQTKREQTITANALIDQVANHLGNTRTICRKCYIHPQIPTSWSADTLRRELGNRRIKQPPTGLDEEETLTMHWLKRQATG